MSNASSSAASTFTPFADVDRELAVTRRVLERLPEEKFAWQPHEKSMSLGRLAFHVATLPKWLVMTITADELDMASPPSLGDPQTTSAGLLRVFDENAAAAKAALAGANDAELQKPWTLRRGEHVLHQGAKGTIVRLWTVNHLVHHRGQLCLYLRLMNVPVPAVYFNSADEPEWVFT
ncbi:MAG: DinB family protein [Planctomycetia bacterium]|nr:DinB family protein [Planctomycetia bacterium]